LSKCLFTEITQHVALIVLGKLHPIFSIMIDIDFTNDLSAFSGFVQIYQIMIWVMAVKSL
jgi:hypothetical protein